VEKNFSVFIYLCSGTTPAPSTVTNYTEVEAWHHERHEVFECVESHMNITSPTFLSVSTSADIEEATVQCLGACQSSDLCEYWTLDLVQRLCHLKETNGSYVATNESVISGEKFCDFGSVEDAWCEKPGCHLAMTINSHCGDEFKLEILGGDFNADYERLRFYINGDGAPAIYCDPGSRYIGFDPSWHTCGIFPIPPGDSFRLYFYSEHVQSINSYHGTLYHIYARVTMNCSQYFATAPRCPTANETNSLEDCNDASCGEHCIASGTLPDGNSN
jgi:hypothetical protein